MNLNGPSLIANGSEVRTYILDLATTAIPVGSTADANGYVIL